MRGKWWSLLLLLLSIGSLTFATHTFVSGRALHARQAALSVEIPQPEHWVPLAADVVVTHADGRDSVHGRFFRDTHGCTRLETGPKGHVAVISISNIPEGAYYRWSSRVNRWTRGPMALPPEGWKPIRRRSGTYGLEKHPTAVEVRAGKAYDLRADAGLAAYRYVNLSGTLSLEVPELNFFSILKHTLEGRREAYSNLELGEQSEELFRAPAGVPLEYSEQTGNIVSLPVEKSKDHIREFAKGGRIDHH